MWYTQCAKGGDSLRKIISVLLSLVLALSLFSACSGESESVHSQKTENATETNTPKEEEITTPEPETEDPKNKFFESDEVVNNFFTDYNAIAEYEIPSDTIKKGNIKTKALVYIDDLHLEIINAKDFLSVSMGSDVENEETKLYSVFRDTIKSMRAEIEEDSIKSAWDSIHESGYLVEDYAFNDILITYVPYKELSKGHSNLRVDLKIPLN